MRSAIWLWVGWLLEWCADVIIRWVVNRLCRAFRDSRRLSGRPSYSDGKTLARSLASNPSLSDWQTLRSCSSASFGSVSWASAWSQILGSRSPMVHSHESLPSLSHFPCTQIPRVLPEQAEKRNFRSYWTIARDFSATHRSEPSHFDDALELDSWMRRLTRQPRISPDARTLPDLHLREQWSQTLWERWTICTVPTSPLPAPRSRWNPSRLQQESNKNNIQISTTRFPGFSCEPLSSTRIFAAFPLHIGIPFQLFF